MKLDWEFFEFKGKVKSCVFFEYEEIEVPPEDEINIFFNRKEKNIFNEKGDGIKEIKYNSDDSIWHKYTYKYDKNGNVIEKYEDDCFYRYTYEYDKEGRIIEECEYKSNVLNERCLYEYNKFGKKIRSNIYDEKGCLVWEFIDIYDDEKFIEGKNYREGRLIGEVFKRYYENGNPKDCISIYDYDFGLSKKWISKFDINGNQISLDIEEQIDNERFKKEKIKYYNDKILQKIVENYDIKNNLIDRCIYKYDDGCKVGVEEYSSNIDLSFTYIYKYDFDEKGNWTKRVKYLENVPCEIIERTFEYFDD